MVDALEVRGYRVQLRTGRNAGGALQSSRRRRDADLRVVFIAAGLDSSVRKQLRYGLDPDQRGDVLILPFDRPRDAIDAIEVATGRIPPRRIRPPRPTRAALTHATLVESKVDVRQWVRPAFAGMATIAALAALVIVSGPARPHSQPLAQPSVPTVTDAPRVLPRSEGITLAAVRPLPVTEVWDDEPYQQAIEDEEVIIITDDDDEPAAVEIYVKAEAMKAATAIASIVTAVPGGTIAAPAAVTTTITDIATAPFDRSILLDPPAAVPHADEQSAVTSPPVRRFKLADPFVM